MDLDEIDTEIDTDFDSDYGSNKSRKHQRAIKTVANRLRAGRDRELSQGSLSSVDVDDEEDLTPKKKKRRKYLRWVKIIILFCLWLVFTGILLVKHVHDPDNSHFICVPNGQEMVFTVPEKAKSAAFYIDVTGPFVVLTKSDKAQQGTNALFVEIKKNDDNEKENAAAMWTIYMNDVSQFDSLEMIHRSHLFEFKDAEEKTVELHFRTNIEIPVSLEFHYEQTPINLQTGLIISLLLVTGLFVLFAFELVHRTLAIILFCTLGISFLALMDQRPSLSTIVSWINFEVLLLIFCFTLIIAILSETGAIDYLTMLTYKLCNGHIWPMLNLLCLITFLGAVFTDSVIMVLLVSPITMRICEIMELNPVPILTCLMISANVGQTVRNSGATVSGEAVSQEQILREEGVNAFVFLAHVVPGMLLAAATAYIYMRIQYHNSNSMRYKDGAEVERLRRVIKVWARTAKSINAYSRDEKEMRDSVNMKVRRMQRRMKRIGKMPSRAANYEETLKELKQQFVITDMPLLYKCLAALGVAAILILLHLIPDVHYLSTAWASLLACMLLLVIADTAEFDAILGRIEWASMVFLACFLVFTEAILHMGLYDSIGKWTVNIITDVEPDSRLGLAILVILWFSALSASFLGEAESGAMMLRTVIVTVNEADQKLPIQPLLWAAVLGTGLGGIGTIVGTYSNVVCASMAEKHGYNFPFLYYCKVGFPIMLLCVVTTTVYLMICHLLFHWH